MLVDEKGRLFKKINLIDLLIILIVLAAGIFVFYKFGKANITTVFEKKEPVILTFTVESVPDYTANAVKEGAVVTDKVSSAQLGKVTKAVVGPDISYAYDNSGRWVQSSKPGYASIELTVEGTGVFSGDGVVNIGNTKYYLNRDSNSTGIYVGNVLLYTRIKDIEKK